VKRGDSGAALEADKRGVNSGVSSSPRGGEDDRAPEVRGSHGRRAGQRHAEPPRKQRFYTHMDGDTAICVPVDYYLAFVLLLCFCQFHHLEFTMYNISLGIFTLKAMGLIYTNTICMLDLSIYIYRYIYYLFIIIYIYL